MARKEIRAEAPEEQHEDPGVLHRGDKGDTVVVALKHPHGIIMRLFAMAEHEEPQPGGGTKTVKRSVLRHDVAPITVRGYLDKYDPNLPPAARGTGYGYTTGVPRDFWEEWCRQNQDLELVKSGLIFAHDDIRDCRAEAHDRRDELSGLEPLDPKALKGRVVSYKPDEPRAA